MSLEIRDYHIEDDSFLIPIIENEWKFHLYGENWPELVREYIKDYVSRSDYCRVAVLDGKVVGIATVCVEIHTDNYVIPEEFADSEYFRDRETMDTLDARLRSEIDISGLGELVLIIVSKEHKGKHIGSALMDDVSGYLRDHGCRGMHISTDTDCNYGFYEHLGSEKVGCGECIVQGNMITRFLYRLVF
ncbi:MAG: GNAT family N-acetyltransferase [archaeon]|nr:GNAT family N-acetyltransferase [archaeon]